MGTGRAMIGAHPPDAAGRFGRRKSGSEAEACNLHRKRSAPLENIRIRRLKVEDAADISRIYGAITLKPVEADFKRIVENHARQEEDACFVAEVDGRPVGFMISYILTGAFGISKSAWIATFGVDPEHMGEGIGASLAREVFKFYRTMGIDNVYTSVRWDSTDLLSFFKTLGFDRSNFINLRKVLA
jgi:ribosomal protein S18 acetylase RimI-like enzyme